MNLLTYADIYKLKPLEVARSLDMSHSETYNYMYEGVIPRRIPMLKIAVKTHGLVDANGFYGITEQFLTRALKDPEFLEKVLNDPRYLDEVFKE
ncbi:MULTISPECIES: hypothetical protein [unclassified Rickettsia]|uniref:hypothetical protein n=1 Tax=unclassified Rickettsia TaxID=114295 RepID=UPI003132E46F